MSIEGKVISLPYIFQVLYVLCFTRPRYQVSVYRTIGPLVEHFDSLPPCDQACHLYMMSEMAKYICMQKDLIDHWGEHISKNSFLFPISLIGEMDFQPKFIIYYLSTVKAILRII